MIEFGSITKDEGGFRFSDCQTYFSYTPCVPTAGAEGIYQDGRQGVKH